MEMESTSFNYFDALSESAKALMNLVLGSQETDLLRDQMKSYSTLIEENKKLEAEVATLEEYRPFKDKYENLRKEFRKVAAERDSLSAQELDISHLKGEYKRCKSAYQTVKEELATTKEKMEEMKSSISQTACLESLYQGFKSYLSSQGIDIRRIPIKVGLQFILQDQSNRGCYLEFDRTSATKWRQTGKQFNL